MNPFLSDTSRALLDEAVAISPARLIPDDHTLDTITQDPMKPVYDVREASALLGLHPETVRDYARTGKLKATHGGRGRRLLISPYALDLFIRRDGGSPLFPNLPPQAWAILHPEDGFERVHGIGLTEEQAWKDADEHTASREGLRAYPATSDLYEEVLSRGSVTPRILSGPLADIKALTL